MVVVNLGLHLSVSLRPVLILIVAHDLVHEDVVVRSTAPHGTPRHCAAKAWVAVLFSMGGAVPDLVCLLLQSFL